MTLAAKTIKSVYADFASAEAQATDKAQAWSTLVQRGIAADAKANQLSEIARIAGTVVEFHVNDSEATQNQAMSKLRTIIKRVSGQGDNYLNLPKYPKIKVRKQDGKRIGVTAEWAEFAAKDESWSDMQEALKLYRKLPTPQNWGAVTLAAEAYAAAMADNLKADADQAAANNQRVVQDAKAAAEAIAAINKATQAADARDNLSEAAVH